MALDPSLSLNIQQPQPLNLPAMINMGLAYQNTQNAQAQLPLIEAQTANEQAKNPGIVAQSQNAQTSAADAARIFAFKQFAGIHAADWTTPSQNGGPPTINYPMMMAKAQDAGYADLVPAISQNYAIATKAGIESSTSQQGLDDAIQKSSQQAKGVISQLVSAAPPDQQADVLDKALTNLGHIYGPNSPVVQDITKDATSQPVSAWLKQAKNQTFTPLEQSNLAIAKQNADTSAASVAISSKTEQMSAADNLVASTQAQNQAGLYEKGAQATNTLDFSGVDSKFGNLAMAKKMEFLNNNPQFAATQRLIDQYNVQNPGANLNLGQGPQAISDALHTQAINLNNQAIAHANIAKLGGISNVLPPAGGNATTTPSNGQSQQPGQPGNLSPISPTPINSGKVKVQTPDGKQYIVNSANVAQWVSGGAKIIGGQ